MDVLNSLLTELKITGSVYFCDFLEPPWKLDYLNEKRGLFHSVRRGRCKLSIGGTEYELLRGDLVFVSPNVPDTELSIKKIKFSPLIFFFHFPPPEPPVVKEPKAPKKKRISQLNN